jgi:hypothetical protein
MMRRRYHQRPGARLNITPSKYVTAFVLRVVSHDWRSECSRQISTLDDVGSVARHLRRRAEFDAWVKRGELARRKQVFTC